MRFSIHTVNGTLRTVKRIKMSSRSIMDTLFSIQLASLTLKYGNHLRGKYIQNITMFKNLMANPKFSHFREQEPPRSMSRRTEMADRQMKQSDTVITAGLSRLEEDKQSEDDEFIGFATLPDQVHRKAVKRGFEFSFMVVGETGLGKSTLINSLFLTDLYKDRKFPNHILDNAEQTVDIERKQLEIEEKGVKVRLSVVDTPGFSEALNGEKSWQPIIDYVDRQFEQYYQAESGVNRKNIQDSRVHCCLYFISPYGHGLKPIDVFMMKKLHHKVNIIPLIAKSDTLTPKERAHLKNKVMEQIEENHIDIYKFPECDSDEDEEFKQQDRELKSAIPFAVVGSNTVVEVAGKKVRGRMYQWGIVEVENPAHCDFVKLRQMLISTHMQDLKDITSDIHYENYRAEHLAEQMKQSTRERTKLKRESMLNPGKLEDTDNLIAQKDAEIQRMQEMLAKMQAQLQTNPRTPVNGT